ncbi:hypothetical protein FA95DRAFT_1614001 [Auriscalpium vulgare]|uniref:Uncharacterized protein n=1 Tax=Auriscalpium vulgare TaxID=40419 RepID=A0ACB8R1Q0_9AGAM|nr:hypothetical protein FA95DRAFT_1614001 [Auriscalpium vulgare]
MVKTRPKLTKAQKEARAKKSLSLSRAITKAQSSQLETAKQIAKEHGRTFKWVLGRLLMGGRQLRQRRTTSAWTTHLAQSLRDINSGRPVGQKLKISSLSTEQMEGIKDEYKALDEEELQELREEGSKSKKEKETAARQTELSRQKDFNSTFSSLVGEVVAVQERTDCQVLLIAVRGDSVHQAQPVVYGSAKAKSWVLHALNSSISDAAIKFEAWSVGDFGNESLQFGKVKGRQEIAFCRDRIATGLDSILHELRKIPTNVKGKMQYKNYEEAIVLRFEVELRGWPIAGTIVDPGVLKRKELSAVAVALKNGNCRWEKLSAEEARVRLAEHEERIALQAAGVAQGSDKSTTTSSSTAPSTSPTSPAPSYTSPTAVAPSPLSTPADALDLVFTDAEFAAMEALANAFPDFPAVGDHGLEAPGATALLSASLPDAPLQWAAVQTPGASSSSLIQESSANSTTLTWV